MPVGLVPESPVLENTPLSSATTITITGIVPSGSVVTGFTLMWERDTSLGCSDRDEDTLTVNGDFTSYEITGLEEGNRYSITVKVFNEAGNSSLSNTVTGSTLEAAPSEAPASVTNGTITATSITVLWQEVTCLGRNGDITGYLVRIMRTGENDIVVEVAGDVMEATVSGLYMATEYSVQVAAVNSVGTGPYSDPLEITTQFPAPGQVSVVVCSITATSISLSWSVVGGSVVWSEVVWRETSARGTESSSGNLTDTCYTIDNLKSSTNYSVIVRVTNIAGTTESSPIFVSIANTDSDDQTTVIAVSVAVGAGLAVILAAGLGGLAALICWLLKRKRHVSSSGGGDKLRMHSVDAVGPSQSPAAVVVYETVGDVVGASTTGPHTIENVAYAVSDTPSTTPNPAYGHLSHDKK